MSSSSPINPKKSQEEKVQSASNFVHDDSYNSQESNEAKESNIIKSSGK